MAQPLNADKKDIEMPEIKEYLGDSVYAKKDEHDGSIILTTENGAAGDPSNTIILEPQVMASLLRFYQKYVIGE
jgi:hypothetical protein